MSKFKIFNLIDKIFITISVFLVIYTWLNFFIRDLYTTFALSLLFSFACVFLLFYFINKKNNTKALNKKRLQDIEENFLTFKLLPNQNKLELLKTILEIDNSVIINKENVTYKKNGITSTIIDATHIGKISDNELINLVKDFVYNNTDIIEIICNEYQPNLKLHILKNKEIKMITKTTLYENFFEKYNTFPDNSFVNLKSTKPTMKDIAKNFFLPHKAKSYFLCGLVLIFSSIIVPEHIYYLVFGTILLLFSIICKILSNIKR